MKLLGFLLVVYAVLKLIPALEQPLQTMTATAITTLAAAVEDTKRLFRRGAWKTLLGIAAYLLFDVLVLWCAFLAVHGNAVPAFPVVIMAYIIGALGGSLPLPAAAGTIGRSLPFFATIASGFSRGSPGGFFGCRNRRYGRRLACRSPSSWRRSHEHV